MPPAEPSLELGESRSIEAAAAFCLKTEQPHRSEIKNNTRYKY